MVKDDANIGVRGSKAGITCLKKKDASTKLHETQNNKLPGEHLIKMKYE